jgi:hypothetical protein
MYDSVQNAVYRPAAGAGLSEVTFVFNLKRNGASRPVFARPWSSVTGQLALFRQKVIASGGPWSIVAGACGWAVNGESLDRHVMHWRTRMLPASKRPNGG